MKRRLPSLNALRAFEAAARLGRMNAAADELSVTPGAISRQVRQLEDHLGLALFEGSKNQPRLSRQGHALLPALSAAFDQMEAALQALADDSQDTLDVACLGTFSMRWLIPRLYHFNALHPRIEVRLSTTERARTGQGQRHDLVIDVGQGPLQAGACELFAEWLGPVLSPALAAALDLRQPPDLAKAPLLRTRTRRNAWAMWCESLGLAPLDGKGAEFEHYYFSIEAALGGLGICLAPWHLVADEVLTGRLLAPFGFQASGYRYRATARAQHPATALFSHWLQQQVAQMPQPPTA
ncbi:MAG: LysR substrate-binding domain-containing protein [Pseudomonas sp.]|uniref:LysR substrate-binding domain-containing protein n=1 Tax=Pseudomonas sp. TaxID=306 RepID=UPI00339A9429